MISTMGGSTFGKLRESYSAHPNRLPTIILAMALVVRLAVVALTRHGYVPVADDADYSRIASSIASDHGFGNTIIPFAHGPSAFRPPLYPAVLALTYLISGTSWTCGRIENAVIGTLAVAAIGFLGQELWNRRVALVAMVIAAIYPPMLLAGYGLGYEALLIALLTASLACMARARRSERPLQWIVLAGVLAGLAMLTQETAVVLLLPLVVVAWQYARDGGARRRVLNSAVAVGAALLVVAPWTIRNAVRLRAFVPVTTALGVAAEGTYNATATHYLGGPDVWMSPWYDPATAKVMEALPDETEVRGSDAMVRLTENYMEAHPTYILSVAYWNSIRLFDLRGPSDALLIARYVPYNDNLVYLSVYSSYFVDLLVVVGCFTQRARRMPWYFWSTALLLYLGLILVSGNIRYRSVIEPFIVLLASLALLSGYERYHTIRMVSPSTTTSS
jgi:4-amino-4-deoxy-L-arabinose transferase-like glycosyltransferase